MTCRLLIQVLISRTVLSKWLDECPGHGLDRHSGGGGLSPSIAQPQAGTAQLDPEVSNGMSTPMHAAQLEAVPASAPATPPGMQRLQLFSLNDYLGLSTHPDVRRAAAEAAQAHGMGAHALDNCDTPL